MDDAVSSNSREEHSKSHPPVLLESLKSKGVVVPNDVASPLTTSDVLISICSQCLNLLITDPQTTSSQRSLTSTTSDTTTVDKLKKCTDIALAVTRLGYPPQLTYYQLLYPSEEESVNLVRFLVERLPESSSWPLDHITDREDEQDQNKEDCNQTKAVDDLDVTLGNLSIHASINGLKDDRHAEETTSHVDQSLKEVCEPEARENEETVHLQEELELLKAAADMVFDNQHLTDFYIRELDEQISARKSKILELESQWEASRKPLEERKRELEESLYANVPEAEQKLQKLREVEKEKHLIFTEVRRRKLEISELSLNLKKLPNLPSRASYVERIKEITKNSRKQDADIERILKETRELQSESNLIQERLHRTYAVLDEIVYREAKKDPVGRKAYLLLTSIHENFEQISEKILATDRVRREVAELEKKLAAMSSRSPIVGK